MRSMVGWIEKIYFNFAVANIIQCHHVPRVIAITVLKNTERIILSKLKQSLYANFFSFKLMHIVTPFINLTHPPEVFILNIPTLLITKAIHFSFFFSYWCVILLHSTAFFFCIWNFTHIGLSLVWSKKNQLFVCLTAYLSVTFKKKKNIFICSVF